MRVFKFIDVVLKAVGDIEKNIEVNSRFSSSQMKEIVQNAKKDNMKFFHALSKIKSLTAFDMSYILSSIDLDEKKINIIERAVDMYDENEFNGQGQTLSDYVFKVATNINLLTEANLDVFKELAQCKSNIYDFTNVLKNPSRYIHHNEQKKPSFCFSTVIVDD